MKTDKLLHLVQQKKAMRSGGALPLPKAQVGIGKRVMLTAHPKPTLEEQINRELGSPMRKAAEAAKGEEWFNSVTGKWEKEDPVDNLRHAMAGRYTAEAIANKFPALMQYTPIPKTAGFLGANILGAAHEAKSINNRPSYSWWDKTREAGEDIINNFVGATIGSLPISDEQKTKILFEASRRNLLPDGYGKGNMYFKEKGGLAKAQNGLETLVAQYQDLQNKINKGYGKEDAYIKKLKEVSDKLVNEEFALEETDLVPQDVRDNPTTTGYCIGTACYLANQAGDPFNYFSNSMAQDAARDNLESTRYLEQSEKYIEPGDIIQYKKDNLEKSYPDHAYTVLDIGEPDQNGFKPVKVVGSPGKGPVQYKDYYLGPDNKIYRNPGTSPMATQLLKRKDKGSNAYNDIINQRNELKKAIEAIQPDYFNPKPTIRSGDFLPTDFLFSQSGWYGGNPENYSYDNPDRETTYTLGPTGENRFAEQIYPKEAKLPEILSQISNPSYKKEFMNKHNITSREYDAIAKNMLGIYGAESKFGTDYWGKPVPEPQGLSKFLDKTSEFIDDFPFPVNQLSNAVPQYGSVGPFQINRKSLSKNLRKKYSKEDLYDPIKASEATMEFLAEGLTGKGMNLRKRAKKEKDSPMYMENVNPENYLDYLSYLHNQPSWLTGDVKTKQLYGDVVAGEHPYKKLVDYYSSLFDVMPSSISTPVEVVSERPYEWKQNGGKKGSVYDALLKYKERPDENKWEFLDPSGLLSWDDAVKGYDSWQKSTRTFPTVTEGMDMFSAVPIFGKAKNLEEGIKYVHRAWQPSLAKVYQGLDYLQDEYNKKQGGLTKAQAGTAYVESLCGPGYIESVDESGNKICVDPSTQPQRPDIGYQLRQQYKDQRPMVSAGYNGPYDGITKFYSSISAPLESNYSGYCPECEENQTKRRRSFNFPDINIGDMFSGMFQGRPKYSRTPGSRRKCRGPKCYEFEDGGLTKAQTGLEYVSNGTYGNYYDPSIQQYIPQVYLPDVEISASRSLPFQNNQFSPELVATGEAEYVPVESIFLPGTPVVKGLGKVGNVLLDAANPLAGMRGVYRDASKYVKGIKELEKDLKYFEANAPTITAQKLKELENIRKTSNLIRTRDVAEDVKIEKLLNSGMTEEQIKNVTGKSSAELRDKLNALRNITPEQVAAENASRLATRGRIMERIGNRPRRPSGNVIDTSSPSMEEYNAIQVQRIANTIPSDFNSYSSFNDFNSYSNFNDEVLASLDIDPSEISSYGNWPISTDKIGALMSKLYNKNIRLDFRPPTSIKPGFYRESTINMADELADIQKSVDAAKKGESIFGANSVSDSSYPLFLKILEKNTRSNKVIPAFTGEYATLNPSGHLTKAGIPLDEIAGYVNKYIQDLEKTVAKKLPKAEVNEYGSITYPVFTAIKKKLGGLTKGTKIRVKLNK